jgi:ATP-dependent RNA helicase DOB1
VGRPENLLPFLSIGRLVHVVNKGVDWGWGASVNFSKKKMQVKKGGRRDSGEPSGEVFIVDVALHIQPKKKNEDPSPAPLEGEGEVEVVPILSDCIKEVSSLKIHLPKDLIKRESRLMIKETLKKGLGDFKGKYPLLDPVKDMKIEDPKLEELIAKRNKLEELKKQIAVPPSLQKNLPVFGVSDDLISDRT